MLAHTGLKRFKCQEKGCSSASNNKYRMTKHYIVKHNYRLEDVPAHTPQFPFTLEACSGEQTGVNIIMIIFMPHIDV